MIGHVIIWLHRSGMTVFSSDTLVVDWIYSFHMTLMFMVSGYVHAFRNHFHDPRGYPFYFKKYFTDIYLPYLIFSYFGFTASLLMFHSGSNPINFNMADISEILTIPYAGFREYWFLLALFIIKLVHSAFEYKLTDSRPCSIFWIFIFCVLHYVKIKFPDILPSSVFALRFGLYFHAGFILKQKGFISRSKHPRTFYGFLLFASGLALYAVNRYCGIGSVFAVTAMQVFMCLAFFSLFYSLNIHNDFLITCGIRSMVIFIVHDYVVFSMTMIYRFTGFLSGMPFIAALLCYAAAVSVPLLVAEMYKRFKFLRWVEYIFYPRKLLLKK